MKGFSVTELMIVFVILAIMSAISLPYFFNYRKLYKAEEQSLKLLDLMRETNQMALTRRRTFRFEVDLTANTALIIDENEPGNADDIQIKSIQLEPVSDIRVNQAPAGITTTNLPGYAAAVYANDSIGHQVPGKPRVSGNTVWATRFRSDGSVVNTAGVPVSATLYVWEPSTPGATTAKNNNGIRVVTLFGGSGAVRYWKYNNNQFYSY